jgi:hypothetical protein
MIKMLKHFCGEGRKIRIPWTSLIKHYTVTMHRGGEWRVGIAPIFLTSALDGC